MNIFRLVGDLSHLLAIIILLLKIWKTRSCAGMRLEVLAVHCGAGSCLCCLDAIETDPLHAYFCRYIGQVPDSVRRSVHNPVPGFVDDLRIGI